MTRFILCDLHIGYEHSIYPAMESAIKYIRANAKPGDEILGLGDWFHIDEAGFGACMTHTQTEALNKLAKEITTRLMPGNHDDWLKHYCGRKGPTNIDSIQIIESFGEDGIWYCHGDEYDPACKYFRWAQKIISYVKYFLNTTRKYFRHIRTKPPGYRSYVKYFLHITRQYFRDIMPTKTPQYQYPQFSREQTPGFLSRHRARLWWVRGNRSPGTLRGDFTPTFVTKKGYFEACEVVHARASIGVRDKRTPNGQTYKGVILGHTHLPLLQEVPALPFLLNGGDMRHSATFVVQDNNVFHLMQWDGNQWQPILSYP